MVDSIRAEELFFAAIELGTPAARAQYLDGACRDEPELRRRVELMLEGHFKAEGFLEPPSAAPSISLPAAPGGDGPENDIANRGTRDYVPGATESIGSRIGPYKLLQRLGEGGMGTVYMAEQEQPVKRRVALKIIKTGMDSAQVTARFEQERQALAMMDHPNIAKVLDAGTVGRAFQPDAGAASQAGKPDLRGRPYFVMELVKGIPITRFCDQEHLTPQERLELFVPVCQAVQHAHQKGIIHRDLKPSNVLIALYDGKAVPKVIDFGVAKATHQKLTERTMFTEVGSIVGTLEYMAPEQAELNNLDIDTRADIYSLGVLLYELLTGSPPFSAKQLRGAAFTEMLRMIREVEPPKPSTRLSSSDELPSIAASRKLEPRRLTSLVTGELDWIVMKALEKDRGRRYETANGLAMDIGRYLSDEPVLASPPSAAYRMKKFVRRNRGPVAAAVALLLALSAGVVGTSIGLVRAENARQAEAEQRLIAQNKEQEALAEKAKALEAAEQERLAKERESEQRQLADEQRQLAEEQKERAEANEKQAIAEKQIAEAVRTFLQRDLLRQADATEQANALRQLGGGIEATENPTIKELLDRAADGLAADKIDSKFPGQREVQAEILQTVGVTYLGIGEYDKAVEFLTRASDVYRDTLGADDLETLATQNNLALAFTDAGKLPQAIALYDEVRDALVNKLGPDDPRTLVSLNNLALACQKAGKNAEAIKLHEQVRDTCVTHMGADHPQTLTSLNNLAEAYRVAGSLRKAIELFEKVRAARVMQLGTNHPHTLNALNNLANAYMDAGKVAEAIELHEQVRLARVRTLGADHPSTIATLNNLAGAYQAAGRLLEAIELLEQSRNVCVANFGAEHPHTVTTLLNLAGAYQAVGRWPEAIALFEHARNVQVTKLGTDHPDTLNTLNNLANAYRIAGRLREAIELFGQARGVRAKTFGTNHPDSLVMLNNLALAYEADARLPEAIELFEQVRDACTKQLGAEHPITLGTLNNLAGAYRNAGRLPEAIALYEHVRNAEMTILGADHPHTLRTMGNLATAYWSTNQLEKSVPLFEDVLKRQEAKLGRQHPDSKATIGNLGVNYKDGGRVLEAIPLLEEAYQARHEFPALRAFGVQLLDTYVKGRMTIETAELVQEQLAEVRKTVPQVSPQLAGVLAQYGSTLLKVKAWANAEPLLRECLAIREKAEPDAWTTFNTKSILGQALAGKEQYADAEPLLLAGYAGLKKNEAAIPPQAKIRLIEALQRLVDFYNATVQAEKADEWQKKLEETKIAEEKPKP